MIQKDDLDKFLKNYESIETSKLVEILSIIQNSLKSEITQNYLKKKIILMKDSTEESEKRTMSASMKPYLEWYLQG
jgi:hypothetical protein